MMVLSLFGRRAAPLMIIAVLACGPGQSEQAQPASPAVSRAADSGEVHLANVRQLTFGGQNAEAYFSPDGRQLIFQRRESDAGCDQQFVMNVDGSDMRRVSSGLGRTTCRYFYQGGARILYASTVAVSDSCPPEPDFSKGYVWPVPDFDLYTSNADGSDLRQWHRQPRILRTKPSYQPRNPNGFGRLADDRRL